MNIGIISQARMSSTRLPGKILKTIDGKTLLDYHLDRLKHAAIPIIVATTNNDIDLQIVQFCYNKKYPVFQGDEENVLKRYFECAQKFRLEVIIRVTSDCPLIDSELIQEGLVMFQSGSFDFVSNTIKRTYPRGFDFEIMTFTALEKAYRESTRRFEIEHVTPYIWKNHPQSFKIGYLTQQIDSSQYRIVVDTIEDFEVIKILINKYGAEVLPYSEIISILDSHPEIAAINKYVQQKSLMKRNKQLLYWQGEFGNEYVHRNRNSALFVKRNNFFSNLLKQHKDINTVLEIGANTGGNLCVLNKTNSSLSLTAIEPNIQAIKIARQNLPNANIIQSNVFDISYQNEFDLVFTCGVLIHIGEKELPLALDKMYKATKKYILTIEYFSPKSEVIPYRGLTDALFKRPYGKLWKEQFPTLELLNHGFLNHTQGFDNSDWWLFKI